MVVGLVETHGRAATAAQLEGLEVLPRAVLGHRGAEFTELDVEAVLARAPQVAIVDELAHTNVPGSRHAKRWQDVHELLDAGIDVVTTVNVQHLESLNDDVEAHHRRQAARDGARLTWCGTPTRSSSSTCRRRRCAAGSRTATCTGREQIDASLTQYFRVGNLTALRELALLWLADRVDDALSVYRREHRIDPPWPARERVVVAVTGGPEATRCCGAGRGSRSGPPGPSCSPCTSWRPTGCRARHRPGSPSSGGSSSRSAGRSTRSSARTWRAGWSTSRAGSTPR